MTYTELFGLACGAAAVTIVAARVYSATRRARARRAKRRPGYITDLWRNR